MISWSIQSNNIVNHQSTHTQFSKNANKQQQQKFEEKSPQKSKVKLNWKPPTFLFFNNNSENRLDCNFLSHVLPIREEWPLSLSLSRNRRPRVPRVFPPHNSKCVYVSKNRKFLFLLHFYIAIFPRISHSSPSQVTKSLGNDIFTDKSRNFAAKINLTTHVSGAKAKRRWCLV